ncbi:esterase FE4-like [Pectinophora gossypiella]|uniref:esterase FE4-like n=1 Tax=Pectinophora gossypiella TaxID=13191 RepID=UPI00214ECCBA|nr:esterase FE4-like [Pectinophora gossypiella]
MKYGKRIVLFTLFALNLVDQPTPPVKIEQGTLTGNVNADGTILEYIGIPYGTVNSSNRFQAPYPPPKWEGIYRATEEYSCPQNAPVLGFVGSEDCLKVNVYVPAKAKRPLPVMVFIHGGAFILGSGGKLVYRPEFLVRYDVILVTFNYRLGVLGFLCLGIKEAPGNAGIKDQIAALRWVKKNISAFGGDPDNITIFGESAGGTSVSLLHASKATEGLFNKMIVQSGSAISNWAINRDPIWVASIIAKALGQNTEDPQELYEIFSKTSMEKLITTKAKKPIHKYFDTELLSIPCVEKPIPGVEPAIDDLPYNLIRSNPKKIPVIYGSNTKEGEFLVHGATETAYNETNYNYLFASDLIFPHEEEAIEVDKKLKKFYFGDQRISLEMKSHLVDLYTQLYFELPEIFEAEMVIPNDVPVFNYIFNYAGGRNFLKTRMGISNETGACHADELLYLFNGNIWPYPITKKDQQMIDWMTMMWTNFAKYGNPTPPSSSLPIKWERSTKDKLNFLYFDDELSIGPMPNPGGYQIWKEVYQKYRRKDLKYFLPIKQ